jgi:hypothetical protein
MPQQYILFTYQSMPQEHVCEVVYNLMGLLLVEGYGDTPPGHRVNLGTPEGGGLHSYQLNGAASLTLLATPLGCTPWFRPCHARSPATFTILSSIRALRKNISTVFVTEDDLRAAKDEGQS